MCPAAGRSGRRLVASVSTVTIQATVWPASARTGRNTAKLNAQNQQSPATAPSTSGRALLRRAILKDKSNSKSAAAGTRTSGGMFAANSSAPAKQRPKMASLRFILLNGQRAAAARGRRCRCAWRHPPRPRRHSSQQRCRCSWRPGSPGRAESRRWR